jgi:hypothetical protein
VGPSGGQELLIIKCNQDHFDKANKHTQATLLSQYLPSSAELFLPPPIKGLGEDFFHPPPKFYTCLKEVVSSYVPVPNAPHVEFGMDKALDGQSTELGKEMGYAGATWLQPRCVFCTANKGTALDL